MLDIKIQNEKEILLTGRFDASQTDKAYTVLNSLSGDSTVDFKGLEYISSAGLGALIHTYTRLKDSGKSIKLVNMNNHIKEVFRISALDKVFMIE
jgi:anti-sigma B factor antagonist